jgi:acyl-ACP thioesterase
VEFVPFPGRGRQYRITSRVRFGDTDPAGRLRLDALARLVQDVGNDDLVDAGLDPASPWVTRRTAVRVAGAWPHLGEVLDVTTFCSGLGSRWGERRTSVRSPRGAVEVSAVWIFIDRAGRPARLPAEFLSVFGESADGRRPSTRLHHPAPPPQATARPWPLRATDVDAFGHVNNAATWEPVEDEVSRRGVVPRWAELEYHGAIGPDDDIVIRGAEIDPDGDGAGDEVRLWLTCEGDVRASARLGC